MTWLDGKSWKPWGTSVLLFILKTSIILRLRPYVIGYLPVQMYWKPLDGLGLIIFLMSQVRCGVFPSYQSQTVAPHKLFLCSNNGCPYRVKASSCSNFIIYIAMQTSLLLLHHYGNYQYHLVLPPGGKRIKNQSQ